MILVIYYMSLKMNTVPVSWVGDLKKYCRKKCMVLHYQCIIIRTETFCPNVIR